MEINGLGMEIRIWLFLVAFVINVLMIAVRRVKFGNKIGWKTSLGGLGIAFSFFAYSLMEIFSVFIPPIRELVFATIFTLSWGFVVTQICGRSLCHYSIPIAETFAVCAVAIILLGEPGIYLSAMIFLASGAYFNYLFKGTLVRFTLLAFFLDGLVFFTIMHIFNSALGLHPHEIIDALVGIFAFLSSIIYFWKINPEVLRSKLQVESMKKSFKI